MKRLMNLAAGLAAAVALTGGSARAATWILSYTSANGAPFAADLSVTASDSLNAVGGYDVTGVSGDVDGDAVTGLIANPGQPFASYSADGLFIFDNVIWPTGAPELSNPGLFFSAASGDEYNLFSDNASTYELYRAKGGYLARSVGTLDIAAAPPLQHFAGFDLRGGPVPEPATWAMLILGFGGVGAILRQRRRPAPAAA